MENYLTITRAVIALNKISDRPISYSKFYNRVIGGQVPSIEVDGKLRVDPDVAFKALGLTPKHNAAG